MTYLDFALLGDDHMHVGDGGAGKRLNGHLDFALLGDEPQACRGMEVVGRG
jgi:hypothetical protein